MPIYTDVPDFACPLLATGLEPGRVDRAPCPEASPLVSALFGGRSTAHASVLEDTLWRHLLVFDRAPDSQYARLIALIRGGTPVPHGVACIARTGSGFQGFHGRSWEGGPGNLHLTVHLAPQRAIPRFESVFMALAATAVAEAIDEVPGLRGRAGIRWVNDVVIRGAKVAGVLAFTQTRGARVTSVVLGIGINVETTPAVPPTPFVPAAASLRDFAADPAGVTLRPVLHGVLRALERNYLLLLVEGYLPLVERYRARSVVVGERVRISSDDADGVPRIHAAGRVVGIGDGLELRLAGRSDPVTRGRLLPGSPPEPGSGRAPPRLETESPMHPRTP